MSSKTKKKSVRAKNMTWNEQLDAVRKNGRVRGVVRGPVATKKETGKFKQDYDLDLVSIRKTMRGLHAFDSF